jgi:hypothetical protein
MDFPSSIRIPIENNMDVAAKNGNFHAVPRPQLIRKLREGPGEETQPVLCLISAVEKQQNVVWLLDRSETTDLLRNAVLQKFEIRAIQVRDRPSVRIKDGNIDRKLRIAVWTVLGKHPSSAEKK